MFTKRSAEAPRDFFSCEAAGLQWLSAAGGGVPCARVIAHDDTMWITYRGGRTVPMKRLNPWAIQRATERPDACNVLIDIE